MKDILSNLLALILTSLTLNGGEIPPELQTEVDALKAAIDAIPEAAAGDSPIDNATADVTNKVLEGLTNLAGSIKNLGNKAPVMDKITEAKFIALNSAMKAFNKAQDEFAKVPKVPKVMNYDFNAMVKNHGLRVFNVNNTNFEKPLQEEFSFSQKLRQEGFLTGLKIKNLDPGTNVIRWNEGTRGENATAIIAIGSDRPTKTNTTSPSIEATNTIGQQTTVSLQLLKSVDGVREVYNDDIRKDIDDAIALQVAAVLTTANNPINITSTVNEGVANIEDVIICAYMQIKQYAGGQPVVIAISSNQYVSMNLLKDKNLNRITPISFPDLQVVTFLPTVTYTDDMIFGWVFEGSQRFYNDGLQIFSDELNGIGVSGDNFKKNQVSLAAQYLNEALLIRGTDIVTTIYDSISGCITELTQGA